MQEKVTDGKDVGQEKAAKAAERRFKVRVQETIQREILEQRIDMELEALTKRLFGSTIQEATDEQVYVALLYLVKGLTDATVPNDGDKKVTRYLRVFLIGKLLSNNLINLGSMKRSKRF